MYQVIIRSGEYTKDVSFDEYRFAIAWAHDIATLRIAESIRVFDETGHLVAQAYKSEGGELRS